jgi:hypothetical protein
LSAAIRITITMARSLVSARTEFLSAVRIVGKHGKDCYAGATLHPPIQLFGLSPENSLANSRHQLLRFKDAEFLGRHINATCNMTFLAAHTVKGRRHMSMRASTPATAQTAAKVGARETGTVPLEKLVEVVTKAAKIGAGVSLLCANLRLFSPAVALINNLSMWPLVLAETPMQLLQQNSCRVTGQVNAAVFHHFKKSSLSKKFTSQNVVQKQ